MSNIMWILVILQVRDDGYVYDEYDDNRSRDFNAISYERLSPYQKRFHLYRYTIGTLRCIITVFAILLGMHM